MIYTQEEAKKIFREAFQSLSPQSDSVAVVRFVAAKQVALTAGVPLRELQAIEDEISASRHGEAHA